METTTDGEPVDETSIHLSSVTIEGDRRCVLSVTAMAVFIFCVCGHCFMYVCGVCFMYVCVWCLLYVCVCVSALCMCVCVWAVSADLHHFLVALATICFLIGC